MSERPGDDYDPEARYGTLGEIAAVDRYGTIPYGDKIPLPRTDPRADALAARQREQEMAQYDKVFSATPAELGRVFPAGSLSRRAGVMDVKAAPAGAPTRFKETTQAQEDASLGSAIRGLTSQVNPDRFHQMQLTWPESTNVEYRGDPSWTMRARTWIPRQWGGFW